MARPIEGGINNEPISHPPAGSPGREDPWSTGSEPGGDGGGGSAAPIVIQPTAAVYGKTLPIVWGTGRVPGQVVVQIGNSANATLLIPKLDGSGYDEKQGSTAIVVIAICEATTYRWGRIFRDRDALGDGTLLQQLTAKDTSFEIVNGATGSVYPTASTSGAWSILAGHPAEGQGFTNTTHLRAQYFALPDGKIPDISFEVGGRLISYTEAGWDQDAEAADALVDVLTDSRCGAGLPTSMVDVETGPDGTAESSLRHYLDMSGWRVSRTLTERAKAIDLVEELCDAVNCRPVWSPALGKLRFVPLGSEVMGSGWYVPAGNAAKIDDNEIRRERGQSDPVTVSQTGESSVFNCIPVTINSCASGYQPSTYEYKDEAHMREVPPGGTQPRGLRRGPAISNGWISQPTHAKALSQLRVQETIYRRKTYSFQLGPRWMLLEPGDLIAFSHAPLGLVDVPLRIETIEDDERGIRSISATEWPAAISHVIDYTTQAHDGYSQPRLPSQFPVIAVANKADTDLGNATNGSVSQRLIADEAVTGPAIAPGSITPTHIDHLDAGDITVGTLNAARVVTKELYVDTPGGRYAPAADMSQTYIAATITTPGLVITGVGITAATTPYAEGQYWLQFDHRRIRADRAVWLASGAEGTISQMAGGVSYTIQSRIPLGADVPTSIWPIVCFQAFD